MMEPVPTPTFESDKELADACVRQAALNRPPYDPQAALIEAMAQFPVKLFQPDWHWLPLVLICANCSGLAWILGYIDWRASQLKTEAVLQGLGALSSGQYTLATLALHLFNPHHKLPDDGLLDLRLLDDWHFELAMHAIRLGSRGVR